MRRLLTIAFIVFLLAGSLIAGGHEHAHESPAACSVCMMWQPSLAAKPVKFAAPVAAWVVSPAARVRAPSANGRALYRLAPKSSPPRIA